MLEPEGLNSNLVYPNGISTSLPLQQQNKMLRSIEGLKKAKIFQPGYAIEYDHIDPRALKHSLESKSIRGLFLLVKLMELLDMKKQQDKVYLLE